jgi:predicted nucleotidyltransferase
MDNVPGLDLLPVHRALLERAVDCFSDDDRIAGIILGGSLAYGTADFYSDVDLYIIARGESFDTVFDEREAATLAIGYPLFRFAVDPIPGGSRDYIVTRLGPVKLDLMYYRESEMLPAPKWAGCRVLKDMSGLMDDVLARSRDITPSAPAPEVLLKLDQRFWTLCWYVFGKIMRGELWEALDGIHTMRSDAILPMLDWMAGRPHEGYRRLERKLDPEITTRLASTLAPLEAGLLYDALQAAMALFRDLRGPLFERCGLTFDPAPDEVIRDETGRRWAARRT